VVLLAGTAQGADPVSSYTYAYTFLQMPYGVVAVTIMSVVAPDLAQRWSTGDRDAFTHRVATGMRAMLALIVPSAVGMLLLATPAVAVILGHGHSTPAETSTTGSALAMFALGLPGFCTYLYVIRILQSMQRTKIAFYLYLVENAINIVLAFALIHPLGVRGLALSLSIAYSAGALCGVALLRQWFGRLGSPALWAPLRRVVTASIAMGLVVLVVSNISGSMHGPALVARVLAGVVAGGLAFVVTITVLGRRAEARQSPARRVTGSSGR
jgi:putative peptidoglycan lipid II flippase